jgi:hypothetical protein
MTPPSSIPAVRQTLIDFSVSKVDNHQVMRALMRHDDWLVPSIIAARLLGQESQDLVILGETFNHPPGTLLLYTDLESALLAHETGNIELGPFARGIRGIEVFGALPAGFSTVAVNEGCWKDQKLYLGAPSFGNAGVWADVIRFEADLSNEELSAASLADRVRAYDAYFVAVHPNNGSIVTITNHPRFKNAGLLFTAPDCLDAFIARVPGASLQTGQTTGARVTGLLSSLGVDGLVINVCGPGTSRAFSLDELM